MCWFCDGKVVGLLSPYSITVVYMPGTSIGFSVSAVFILTLSTHVSGFTLHTVTLQAHVRFKIYKFYNLIFFILTLSTHVSGFTLHTFI